MGLAVLALFQNMAGVKAGGRRITREEIRAYKDRGVVVCKGLLDSREVETWRAAWGKLKEEIAVGTGLLKRHDRFVGSGDLPAPLSQVYSHPVLLDIVRRMIGPDVALYYHRLLVKDECWDGHVAPHQDCVYFHGSTDKLSVFVPLSEFTARTGAVKFVEGSHRFGNLGRRATIKYEDWDPMPLLTPDAYPGDVILASFETWHHSDAAETPSDRPLMQIVYQSAADGSYYGEPNAPTLVCGKWRTDRFVRYLHGIEPHA